MATPKGDTTKELVSIIKDDGRYYFIRWGKEDNYFTLEDRGGDFVVVFKDSINNVPSEIEKLKDVLDTPKI